MNKSIPMHFMSNESFCKERSEILEEIIALKKERRVLLGPDISIVFEHPRLVWWQIQEMLRAEQGGEAQLHEEWAVYQPLLPSAHFLTLTMMIEIYDPIVRQKTLAKRIGIENQFVLEGAGFRTQSQSIDAHSIPANTDIACAPEQASTLSDKAFHGNKTSSVHFLRFPLNHSDRKAFALGEPVLSCHHQDALYRTPISRALWTSLCHDLGITPLKY